MDSSATSNPQHYQPLSHALHPPPLANRPRSPYNAYDHNDRRDDDEEEEEEEEVEGEVDPQLNANTASAAPSAPQHINSANNGSQNAQGRRRPGRPKGSKNKKPRFEVSTTNNASPPKPPPPFTPNPPFYGYPPGAVPMQPHPPPHPVPIPTFPTDANQQQYFDFQWRVLTLCSEFYNAADELIRGAPPHVVAQCFSLPGNHVDPITVLHEARRACDQLMANPSQAVLKPPTVTTPGKGPVPPPAAPVITNAGSFVMSLSGQAVPPSPYQTFAPGRYPATSYYAYATQSHAPGSHPYMAQQQVMKPVNLSTPAAAGNQGAWSDEETDKLRRLAEESKSQGTGDSGEIDWDWVCNSWGAGRTRHQILIKATNVGLKESSTRGMKRRRETEPGPGADANSTPVANSTNAPLTPDRSTSMSASPVAQHSAVPASGGTATSTATGSSSGIPAPVTAANTGAAGSLMWGAMGNRFYRDRQSTVAAKQ